MIYRIHQVLENKQVLSILFMDKKSAFVYVFWAKFIEQIAKLDIENDRISWTKSFLTNRSVKLVIDRYINLRQKVEIASFPYLIHNL